MRIAICGKMRSGKDTIADILVDDYGFKNFKFSSGITSIIDEYFSDDVTKKRKMREHYQRIGQSMRKLDQNVWVNHTKGEINRYLNLNGEGSDIVVSDLRQKNEYDFLKRNGFIIIKIESDRQNRIRRAMDVNDAFHTSALDHETELSVEDITEDYLIENNGTLEDLKKDFNELMIKIIWNEMDDLSLYKHNY